MLQDVARGVDILKAVRDVVPPEIPTTISLRRGFDEAAESVDRFHRIVETAISLGFAAIRVHARTVEQKYQGRARWPFLKQIKAQYPGLPLFGSGDVFTAEDVVAMLETTGVDAVWIARGAIGNPWIFRHAAMLLEQEKLSRNTGFQRFQPVPATNEADGDDTLTLSSTGRRPVSQLTPPSIAEQREALAEHFSIAMQIHGESLAGRRMRKMGIKYSRFHPESARVKRDFIEVYSLRDWTGVLDRWYGNDGPGVWPAPDAADEVNSDEPASCGIDS